MGGRTLCWRSTKALVVPGARSRPGHREDQGLGTADAAAARGNVAGWGIGLALHSGSPGHSHKSS